MLLAIRTLSPAIRVDATCVDLWAFVSYPADQIRHTASVKPTIDGARSIRRLPTDRVLNRHAVILTDAHGLNGLGALPVGPFPFNRGLTGALPPNPSDVHFASSKIVMQVRTMAFPTTSLEVNLTWAMSKVRQHVFWLSLIATYLLAITSRERLAPFSPAAVPIPEDALMQDAGTDARSATLREPAQSNCADCCRADATHRAMLLPWLDGARHVHHSAPTAAHGEGVKLRAAGKLACIPEKIAPTQPDEYVCKPEWLHVASGARAEVNWRRQVLRAIHLHIVFEEPNPSAQGDLLGNGAVTLQLTGDICTRRCRFCESGHGKPHLLDAHKPANPARTVAATNLCHAVVILVNRGDLQDDGTARFTRKVR